MPERLTFKTQEHLHLFTKSGGHVNAVIIATQDEKTLCVIESQSMGTGTTLLYWDQKDEIYRTSPTGYEMRVERPAFVRAVLKSSKTSDGIMEVEAPIGKRYKLDIVSVEDRQWGHADYPGQTWTRKSGELVDDAGVKGVLPIELFEIESN